MGSELAVWLFDRHVGTLSIAKGRLHFAYEPTWLSHPQAIALSYSLPLHHYHSSLSPRGQPRGPSLA